MWFTEADADRVGRITPSGVITEFSKGIVPGSGVWGIALGPDGKLWFTQTSASRIGRITPDGTVDQLSIPGLSRGVGAWGIAAGPGGNMWFTVPYGPKHPQDEVGSVSPTGVISLFSRGISEAASPAEIAPGPDGNMWFTEYEGGRIGKITPTGEVTEYTPDPSSGPTGAVVGNSIPRGITAGPDGNMWFADELGFVRRITTAGVITKFRAKGMPWGIAAGPDGNLWFTTGMMANAVGRITPAGRVRFFTRGLSWGSNPRGIAAGPDGNMWFAETDGNRIGRITMNGVISEFPATAQFRSFRQVGTRVVIRLRCPVGAAMRCEGTVRLGKTGNGGIRRLPPLRAGQSTTVVIPISPKWRRLLATRGRLSVQVWMLPVAHSMAGVLSQPIVLRTTTRPSIPAVVG